MNHVFTLFVLTSIAASGQGPISDSARMANIHVLVTDGWGNPVSEAMVQLKPMGGWGSPRWIRYPKESRITIPPGAYVVSVDANGFRKYADIGDFSAGKSFVPLSLVVADIETPEPDRQPSLIGRVARALLTNPPFWIRIVGINSGDARNIEIDDTGTFAIPHLLPGRYMVFVMNAGVLKDSRIVEVRSISKEIEIDAPEKALPE
ncbi:hypothetical protein [Paludibaculum fermentans]|uniref:Carboxypeptidase regulatory-like domain-containing protein n=1 Tax=Paludibaculum fermentans TaxID=1473598 RepID=A0A7S7NX82_PALFE|nr:hypothetical protein [Paludibaculum fermentans]QOY91471.1 hypothetical protein IRI77_16435 [Paludibaculum fermentans]